MTNNIDTIIIATKEDLKPGNYFLWRGTNNKSYKTLININMLPNFRVVSLVEYNIISPEIVKYYVIIKDSEIIREYNLYKECLDICRYGSQEELIKIFREKNK